jgi:nucleotide-binding universal stress UspA family protein
VIHDVLVHANSFETWSAAVVYAANLAVAQEACLTAAYVYPSPAFMMPAYGASALLTAIVEHTRRIELESLDAEQRFVAWANSRGVRKASWQVAEGYLPEALSHLGNWHDVLVLGHNGEMPWESPTDLGALVVQSHLPCIVVPQEFDGEAVARRVAVAWNAAPEALRAVHAALPLLKAAERVVLLNGRPRNPLAEIDWRPQFDIHAFLRRHGIEAQDVPIGASDADAGDALLDAAATVKADLLVMGAYGRNRFSEWAFGGATRCVLDRAVMPVLMRH